ncbi:MAG: porin [Syntrophales bacterium]|nr:porin [Syntrophales bacterium]
MKTKISIFFLFTLCVFLSGVPLANAAGSDESLLELLKKKGVLTDEEVSRQKETVKKDDESLMKKLASPLKSMNLKVFGRIQPRHTFIKSDSSAGQEQTSNFTMRRARIGVMGDITKDIEFFMQYESASTANATSLIDASVTFKQFDEWGRIVVGQQFIPGVSLNSSGKTMITEREFTKFVGAGQSGRGRGIVVAKGGGLYGKGFFGDRLGYALGIFNGPDMARDNDKGDNLYGVKILLTPFGGMTGDEYNIKFSPLKFQIAASFDTSRDNYVITPAVSVRAVPARNAAPAITGKTTDNWYSADFQLEWNGWYFGSQWSRLSTDKLDTLPERDSDAYFAGLTKSFKMPNNQFLGVGFMWQHIDNEHPDKTQFFGPRTTSAKSTKGPAGGLTFNKGDSYHPVITYMFTPALRLQIEYAMYKEADDQKEIDNNTLFTQLTVDF